MIPLFVQKPLDSPAYAIFTHLTRLTPTNSVRLNTLGKRCDGFVLFKNRAQLVSFAGYDVVKKDFGSVESKGHISKKGNRFIRRALHWPAQVAIKLNPDFQNYAQRIVDKTKIKMKGAVAIQRKLLILVYKLFVNDTVFDPQYQKNKDKENSNLNQISMRIKTT